MRLVSDPEGAVVGTLVAAGGGAAEAAQGVEAEDGVGEDFTWVTSRCLGRSLPNPPPDPKGIDRRWHTHEA